MKKLLIYTSLIFALAFTLSACTLPGFSTPTPFDFPTPDKTMTALFEPTEPPPATSAATETEEAKSTGVPTNTPMPEVTDTEAPTATLDPTDTPEPTESYAGPAARPGENIPAHYLSDPPTINGYLEDWDAGILEVITHVVYGEDNYTGKSDASGKVEIGWDDEYLYINIRVTDDKYVQISDKQNIYKGDSFEILLDTHTAYDYYLASMNWDDYQIGISPGQGNPNSPECYIWYPLSKRGSTCAVQAEAVKTGQGYIMEMALPWSLFEITPQVGDKFGFALSLSDNDEPGEALQQSMVSNVSTRYFSDPTTWGDLILKDEK